MAEDIFLVHCSKCKRQQQILSRKKRPSGSRTCVFCHKNFQINRETIIRKVK